MSGAPSASVEQGKEPNAADQAALEMAEQGGLAGSYKVVDEDSARFLLETHFGITGKLTRFATEKDDTFKVAAANGQAFVLKIANPGELRGELEFQQGILQHIEAADPTIPVPRVVADRSGAQLVEHHTDDGSRLTQLLTFIEGIPLDSTSSSPAERVEIGKMLARLRYATQEFSHPFEDRYLAWDVQHLKSLEPLLEHVDDDEKRSALSRGLGRFEEIHPRLVRCRKQVLHNDFSKSNIVVDHDDPAFVKGIIDFGDSVKTYVAIDVATALLNQLPEEPNEDLFYRGRDIMDGYMTVAELSDEELALIPHLVMARVVARALLTLWRSRLFPENETYIMRNTKQGWHQLDWFLARPLEEISGILMPWSKQSG